MNNFLQELKELGYTQEEAIILLKEIKGKKNQNDISDSEDVEQESQDQESEESEISLQETEQPIQPEMDINKIKKEITKDITKSVSNLVNEELSKQLKKIRGNPPKGTVGDDPIGNKPIIKKNWFEVMV